jgi:hypothetical protein
MSCDRRYLQILELAAKEGEARVDDALRLLLASEAGKQTIADKEAFEQRLGMSSFSKSAATPGAARSTAAQKSSRAISIANL